MKKFKKITISWMKNKSRFLFMLLVFLVVPIFSGCGTQDQGYSVNLEIWGPIDESIVYNDVINKYKSVNPYVGEIKYRKFSFETYRQELIDALASGQGPDIFLINNTWLPSFENKLEPAPLPIIGEQEMSSNFPDVVSSDFMDEGKTYAVPLSVDSLQLYYNKDIFNNAGITTPPKTWQEFNNDVQALTKIDGVGNIVRSGASIGTAQNVSRATDILGALMLQNGVELPTRKGMLARIDQGVIGQDGNVVQAGEQALGYYTQFARVSMISNISNPLYSWNNRQNNSVEAFSAGNVAMMAGYSWHAKEIKSRNPKLNFGVVAIPQANTNKPLTIASYWGYAVSKNKLNVSGQQQGVSVSPVSNGVRTHEAWQFLKFLTLKNSGTVRLYNGITKNSKDFPISYDPALEYLKKTGQPAARRDLIDLQKTDSALGVFATGNLIARSWYQADPDSIEKIFSEGIDSVVRGDSSLHQSLALMSNRINALMQVKK